MTKEKVKMTKKRRKRNLPKRRKREHPKKNLLMTVKSKKNSDSWKKLSSHLKNKFMLNVLTSHLRIAIRETII